MLFNSYVFILLFLPATVLAYHGLRRLGRDRAAIASLVAASFVFYAWWDFRYLFLLLALMAADFAIARGILARRGRRPRGARALLVLGLAVNLGALGYYKYANFFVDNVNALLEIELALRAVVLPIGISFFTFQKIAFLVDLYQGKVERFSALDYALFVTFFPQLIAGPIVHHSEMMPQFAAPGRVANRTLLLGVSIFAIGLAKKVLLADSAALYASPGFDAAAAGEHLDLVSAWSAVLAYTAQIYFDFSAYSDMAIGIGLLFGIRLPVNFDSPYKSFSIVEFWRRWHITLSRFLRDYLYIPLGGNRHGPARRYVNLYLTMVLGGIWHGAGWTFVTWGALHGIYLIVNHAWHALCDRHGLGALSAGAPFRALAWLLTFLAVVLAWVFFRAADQATAYDILRGLAGAHGVGSPGDPAAILVPVGLLVLALLAPNTQQITRYLGPPGTYGSRRPESDVTPVRWRPSVPWAMHAGILLSLSLMFLSRASEFIYFQF